MAATRQFTHKTLDAGLEGSKTAQNLKDALAGESQADRRDLYFANQAHIEGRNDVAMLFRFPAEGETGRAHGHVELRDAAGDLATGCRRNGLTR